VSVPGGWRRPKRTARNTYDRTALGYRSSGAFP
jgi:hypothetical protein